jgi:hypothetical protein
LSIRGTTAAQNNLTIAFVAPNCQDVNKLLYQYKLEGVSEEWRAPTAERSVTFEAWRRVGIVFWFAPLGKMEL